MRIMLKSRLRGYVTDTNLECEGSITIGKEILDFCDILPDEQVHVLNVNTSERFTTYAREGKDGEIILNGAAARKGKAGDPVIILTYEIREV